MSVDGDVTGDGAWDLVVGAENDTAGGWRPPVAETGWVPAGAVYVFAGPLL